MNNSGDFKNSNHSGNCKASSENTLLNGRLCLRFFWGDGGGAAC